MIVDDEQRLCEAVERMIADEHDSVWVLSCEAAQEAIESGEPFDGIVCDLMMPGMSGMDLHAWLEEAHPDLARKTVSVTGGGFTPKAREFLKRVPNPRLEKPFDPQNLKALLSSQLD